MELLVIWVACGIFAAMIAAAKGRSGCAWMFLGVIFGIFALLAVGFLPSVKHEPIKVVVQNTPPPLNKGRKEKACPDCAEMVLADARVCKHCGYKFDGSGEVKALAPPAEPTDRQVDRYDGIHARSITALKALAEAAGPISHPQVAAITNFIAMVDPSPATPESEAALRAWILELQPIKEDLRTALASLPAMPLEEADDFRTAAAAIVRLARAGDLERQQRFYEQLMRLLPARA